MPKPLATTKQSAPDHSALIDLFQRLGHSYLEKAIAAQVDCTFYKDLLKRLKADEPVAEFKGIPKAKIIKTLGELIEFAVHLCSDSFFKGTVTKALK